MAKKNPAENQQKVAERDYTITYFIKEPTETRRSFAIVKRKQYTDGSREHSTVKQQIIKNINKEFKDEKISYVTAKMRINEIKDGFFKTEKKLRGVIEIDAKNEEVYHTYLEKHYSKMRREDMKDFNAAKNEVQRAFKALGNVSIRTASRNEIENKIFDYCGENKSKARRIAGKLNAVLKSIGRNDIQLTKVKKPHKEVKYVTEAELEDLINYIKKEESAEKTSGNLKRDEFINLVKMLFYSGLRIGETKALTKNNWDSKNRIYHVTHQVDDEGAKRLPKGDKQRKIVVHEKGVDAFEWWINFKNKKKINRNQLTRRLKRHCEKKFENDQVKHLTLHCLRHSFAIYYLRDLHLSLSAVAGLLGDSIQVTEEYYANFILHDETLEFISRKTS